MHFKYSTKKKSEESHEGAHTAAFGRHPDSLLTPEMSSYISVLWNNLRIVRIITTVISSKGRTVAMVKL